MLYTLKVLKHLGENFRSKMLHIVDKQLLISLSQQCVSSKIDTDLWPFFFTDSHFFWPKLILYTCSSSTILLIWSAPCRHFLLPKLKSILKRWCRQLKALKKNSRTDLHIILKESYLVASMSKKCIKKLQNYLNRPCNLIKLTENSAFQGIQKYQLQLIFKNVSLLIILL